MVFKLADRSPPNRQPGVVMRHTREPHPDGRPSQDRSAKLPVAVPRTTAAAAGDRDNDRDASLPLRRPRHALAEAGRLAGRLSERLGEDALMVGADRAQVHCPARIHRRTPEAACDLRRSLGIGALRGMPTALDQPQARRDWTVPQARPHGPGGSVSRRSGLGRRLAGAGHHDRRSVGIDGGPPAVAPAARALVGDGRR